MELNKNYWKIPRPVDLTKYIGKVVKCIDRDSVFYVKLTKDHIRTNASVEIEPLTSEDITPNES